MDLIAIKNTLQNNKWSAILPVLLIVVLIVGVNKLNVFTNIEYNVAASFKSFITQNYDNQLTVIEYSPKEINRAEIAGLIQTLADANARSILLDLDLSYPSAIQIDDTLLSQTLKANKRTKIILPIYESEDKALRPLTSFSKYTKLGYVNLQSDIANRYTPIDLKFKTAANEFPHAIVLQLGLSRPNYSSTLVEPGINIDSFKKLSFSETIAKNHNHQFAHKHILIGPNTKRTTTHALLFKTLRHGKFIATSDYLVLAIFSVLAVSLIFLFTININLTRIVLYSAGVVVSPFLLSLISIVFFRALTPACSLAIGLAFISTYLSYLHRDRFLFNSANIKDEDKQSDSKQAFLEGEISIGKNGVILKTDPIITKLIGCKEETLTGTPIRNIVPSLKQEKWRSFYSKLKKLENPSDHIYDFEAKHADGKLIKVQLQPKVFASSSNLSVQFVLRNTLGKSGKQVALEYQAKHDEVSKTLNKAGIIEHLSNEIVNASDTTLLSVILLQLDNFNEILDSLGENACEKILKSFSKRLHKCTDESTVIGRINDSDFLLVTKRSENDSKTQSHIRKIVNSAKNAIHTSGISVELNLHAGIANFSQHGKNASELIANSRTALTYARESQKNLMIYAPKIDKNDIKPAKKVSDIQKAVKENQLKLYYQPIINLHDYSVSSVEALLRWQHPQHGLMLPNKFIKLVEHSKLVRPVTKWVINQALKDARSWQKHGINLNISVNISERNLLDSHFHKLVEECISKNEMKPENLELEISEKKFEFISEQAIKLLERLTKRGVSFSLDNFGVGKTSLLNLRELPFTKIKIDQSLANNVIKTSQDEAIIDATIRMAHAFGIGVVAEGIESELHFKKFQKLDCDYCQGHLFSKPVRIDALMELFEAWENTLNAEDTPTESMATWNGQYSLGTN